ncbi:selenoprotein W-related protein [Pedobacter sp. UYP30]|uniref:SelT/SelW/SelH family protein n=1 Tax=Pedobacter sp. UYP30 TaxID=1756400 RepID=UPI00339B48B0
MMMIESKPLIEIEYCPKCGWLLRSAYMAQELLNTFVDELRGVTLIPSEIGGTFTVKVDGSLIFDRQQMQRFPEIKELKKLVRDAVSPDKDLGHSEK